MKNTSGRYSVFIRPLTYLLDLIIINGLSYFLLSDESFSVYITFFLSLCWIIIAINIGFYEVYRFTKVVSIIEKIVKQYIFYTIVCFAFLGFYFKNTDAFLILKFTSLTVFIIAFFKLAIFYFLKKYRALYGGNFRNVVVIGKQKNVATLLEFFEKNPDYGYKLEKYFSLDDNKKENIENSFSYISNQSNKKIDEIYCSLADLSDSQVNDFIDFSDNNLKVLKFLPDDRDFFSKNMKLDYYGLIPIISLRDIPLDDSFNKTIKRIFDIVFSTIVIIGLLSWLIPILAFFIKRESKGPVFFVQKRNGLNYKEFNC